MPTYGPTYIATPFFGNAPTADEKIQTAVALRDAPPDEYYEPFDYEYDYHSKTPGWLAIMDTISKYPDELYSLLIASAKN